MKNANSRFVRVLALVLVVLMVVPAALVGCGSNKANNAAISEALAAAEAARKEAEEAKAAADAAAAEAAAKAAEEAAKLLEEANKKAEEALKAAEEAKKELEEAKKTTAAPETTAPAPTEDLKVVSDYAYQVLNNKDLDFLKAYFTYAYGKTEKELEKLDVKETLKGAPANSFYTDEDVAAMEDLYDATVVAIMQAPTTDYINVLVGNFVSEIAATKTYVEHVIAAYEAIDPASNYDVVDVVYAYQLLVKALADAEDAGVITGTTTTYLEKLEEALTKYGEDKVDVINAIGVQYYRYTGATLDNSVDADIADIDEDDILYADMYTDAAAILKAVQGLITGAEYDEDGLMILDAAKLPYSEKVESSVANVVKEYTKWNTKYFVNADDTKLVEYYEDFRKAFVGETYILVEEADYVWEALVAFEARATELLAAAAEYEAGFKTELNSVAKPDAIKYWNYIEKVAKVDAALDAWKLKYGFEDLENGDVDPNVVKIIEKYAAYAKNAAIVSYFVYLEKNASAVNASAFLNAYKEDLHDNKTVMFTYSKYGSAVASVLDWYFGKKKDGTRDATTGFISIAPNADKDFFTILDDANDTYKVSNLLKKNDINVLEMFERVFDLDIADAGKNAGAFDDMSKAYEALYAAKEDADSINDDIEEYLEKGVSVKVEADLKKLLGDDYAYIFDPDVDDEEKYTKLAGALKADLLDKHTVIVKGDANFIDMIDWANIETLYDNYNASTKNIKEAATEVALMYIAWKGTYDSDKEAIIYKDNEFENLDPIEINIYSYDTVKKALDLYDALDVKNASAINIDVPKNNDEDYTITLKDVANFCVELRTHFYSIVDTLQIDVYNTIYNNYPLLSQKAYSSKVNGWRSAYYNSNLANREAYYNDVINAGTRVNEQNDPNDIIKPAILQLLKDNRDLSYKSSVQYGNKNNTPGDADFMSISYEFAVYSVSPLDHVTMSAEGKVLTFDATAYKNAVLAAIDGMYKSYLVEYLKDDASIFKGIVNTVAVNALNTGLWTIADEIVIAEEDYAFQINTNKFGTAWEFEIIDADPEFVTQAGADAVVIKVEPKKGEIYNVTLTAALVDGVLKITPAVAVHAENTAEKATKTVYDLVAGLNKEDFDEGEAPYFAFDVRNYAEQIATNGDKVTNIELLGGKKATLDTFSAAQYETLFTAEAKNAFYHAFTDRVDAMYNASAKHAKWLFGDFFTNIADKSDIAGAEAALTTTLGDADKAKAVVADLVKISQAAYQLSYGMTFDANSIEDIAEVFDAFVLEVCHKLDQHGVDYDYVEGALTLTINGLK